MKPKATVGIIGAGDIGFNIAELLAFKGHDVIIYNRYHEESGKPSPVWLSKMGKVMDLHDSLQIPGTGSVSLTSEINKLNGVQFLVVTAGAKRSSISETREELASKNASIIGKFSDFIVNNPETLVMIVSNPVDFLTNFLIREVAYYAKKPISEIAKKIVGVSYIDSMRLKNAVKEFLNEHHPNLINPIIEGIAVGEHGPMMVPIMSQVTVNAKPIESFANSDQIEAIRKQTILRGNDIIKLTGASSVSGPAHAAVYMIEEIDKNPKVQIPCSVWDGERAVGKLVEFLAYQVHKIIPITKVDFEIKMIEECIKALDDQYQNITNKLKNS